MEKMAQEFMSNLEGAMTRNWAKQQKIDRLKQEEKNKERVLMEEVNLDSLKENQNETALHRIKELGFTVQSYRQEEHPGGSLYYKPMDVFTCSYKDWLFEVEWTDDPDIEEGILALRDPHNRETGETLDFYCDLYCQNTPKNRLEKILDVFEKGCETFLVNAFGRYFTLPDVLRQKGFVVTPAQFDFDIKGTEGYLLLDNGIAIHFHRNWEENVVLAITDDINWNGQFESASNPQKAYRFDYRDERDADELVRCIQSYKEFKQGKWGYRETDERDGKKIDVYYKGEDFLRLFHMLKTEIKAFDHEKWNTYFVQFDNENKWNYCEEEKETVNHYVGLEIDEQMLVSINDAAQWTVGEEVIRYRIAFVYDRRKDPENCVLTIDQWVVKKEDEPLHFASYNNQAVYDSAAYKGRIERKGTFTALVSELDVFLRTTLRQANVNI